MVSIRSVGIGSAVDGQLFGSRLEWEWVFRFVVGGYGGDVGGAEGCAAHRHLDGDCHAVVGAL